MMTWESAVGRLAAHFGWAPQGPEPRSAAWAISKAAYQAALEADVTTADALGAIARASWDLCHGDKPFRSDLKVAADRARRLPAEERRLIEAVLAAIKATRGLLKQ